jgi:hypothetical protein
MHRGRSGDNPGRAGESSALRKTSKPPFQATRVLRASLELTPAMKMVWLELYWLDNGPEGAYIGAEPLAHRVGQGRDNVEKIRRELAALGLLDTRKGRGRRTASWWPTMPAQFIPHETRPQDREVFQAAQELDEYLKARRCSLGGVAKHSCASRSAVSIAPFRTFANPAIGVLASALGNENGVREYATEEGEGGNSTLPKVGTTHPTSPNPAEVGGFVTEPGEGGAVQDVTDWRRFLGPPPAKVVKGSVAEPSASLVQAFKYSPRRTA